MHSIKSLAIHSILMLFITSLTHAQIEEGSIKVLTVAGNVWLIDGESGKVEALSQAQQFTDSTMGVILFADPDASADIQFANGTVLRLENNAVLGVSEYLQAAFDAAPGTFASQDMASGSSKTVLLLSRGTITGNVVPMEGGSSFEVYTDAGLLNVEGGSFSIEATVKTGDEYSLNELPATMPTQGQPFRPGLMPQNPRLALATLYLGALPPFMYFGPNLPPSQGPSRLALMLTRTTFLTQRAHALQTLLGNTGLTFATNRVTFIVNNYVPQPQQTEVTFSSLGNGKMTLSFPNSSNLPQEFQGVMGKTFTVQVEPTADGEVRYVILNESTQPLSQAQILAIANAVKQLAKSSNVEDFTKTAGQQQTVDVTPESDVDPSIDITVSPAGG